MDLQWIIFGFIAYCSVDSTQVRTFSNRQYNYSLSPSWHVVMQNNRQEDQEQLAVLARRPNQQQLETYISYRWVLVMCLFGWNHSIPAETIAFPANQTFKDDRLANPVTLTSVLPGYGITALAFLASCIRAFNYRVQVCRIRQSENLLMNAV